MDGRRVRAVFAPTRTDDLKPAAAAIIGHEYIWDQAWVIEPEDGGPYVGQDAWCFAWEQREGEGVYPIGVAWVPTEDLRVVEVISGAWTSEG